MKRAKRAFRAVFATACISPLLFTVACNLLKHDDAADAAAAETATATAAATTAAATTAAPTETAAPLTTVVPAGAKKTGKTVKLADGGTGSVVALTDGGQAIIPTFALPSSLPSTLPSGFPTALPSTIPTTLPSNLQVPSGLHLPTFPTASASH